MIDGPADEEDDFLRFAGGAMVVVFFAGGLRGVSDASLPVSPVGLPFVFEPVLVPPVPPVLVPEELPLGDSVDASGKGVGSVSKENDCALLRPAAARSNGKRKVWNMRGPRNTEVLRNAAYKQYSMRFLQGI